jgi:hypothetical protein
VVSDEPLAVIPSMPISQLLGRTRANITARLDRSGGEE